MWYTRAQVHLWAIMLVIASALTVAAQDAGTDAAAGDDTVREFPEFNVRLTLPPNGQWGRTDDATLARFRTSRTEIVTVSAVEADSAGIPSTVFFDRIEKAYYERKPATHIGRLKTTYKGLPTLVLHYQEPEQETTSLFAVILSPRYTYRIERVGSSLTTVDVYGILQSLKFLTFITDPEVKKALPPDPEPVREFADVNARITLPTNGHWQETPNGLVAQFSLEATQIVMLGVSSSPAEMPKVDTDQIDRMFLDYGSGSVKISGATGQFRGMPAYQAHFRDPATDLVLSAVRFYTSEHRYDLIYFRYMSSAEIPTGLPEEFQCFTFINPPTAPSVVTEAPPAPPAPKKKAAVGNYLVFGVIGLVVFLAVGGLIFNIVRKARQ